MYKCRCEEEGSGLPPSEQAGVQYDQQVSTKDSDLRWRTVGNIMRAAAYLNRLRLYEQERDQTVSVV